MKNMLVLSSLFFAFAAQAEETFVPKRFTWTYSLQAQDASNCDDILKFHGAMRSMIDEINVNRSASVNMYEKLLVFIKEAQEAILAGFNLFSSSHTTVAEIEDVEAAIVETVTEVLEQAADAQAVERTVSLDEPVMQEENDAEVIDATQNSDVAEIEVVQTVNPVVYISISCTVLNASEVESWNNATAMLQDLSDKINAQVLSPLEVIDAINEVAVILQQLQSADMFFTAA